MKLVETSHGKLYVGSKDNALELIEKKAGFEFDVIWNLAKEFKFLVEDELKCSRLVLFGNIKDYDIPTDRAVFTEQLTRVVTTLRDGGKVFIHCFAGHGRTGMALAVVKKTLDGMTADDAINFAKYHCQGPESDKQQQFIHSL